MSENLDHKLKALQLYADFLLDHHETWHTKDINHVRYQLRILISHINKSSIKKILLLSAEFLDGKV